MLIKAGADILMPVTVGDVVGTAVDYAHYSFNQVTVGTLYAFKLTEFSQLQKPIFCIERLA